MPYSIDRWRGTEVIVVRAHDSVSGDDSEALLSALEAACATQPSTRVILDLSAVDYIPTAPEARSLARRFADLARPIRCRIAVVAQPGAAFGMARMIGTLTSIENVEAGAFTSVDQAVEWMNAEGAAR